MKVLETKKMGITAKEGKKRELTPAGTHFARCYKMIHYGHVPDSYMGEMKIVNKVKIDFELPNEMRVFDEAQGPQPMSISKEYTVSLNEGANLRKDLESWRGKAFTQDELQGFDITDIISAACLVTVIHKTSAKGNQYAQIASISPVMKGTEAPAAINSTFVWDYEEHFDLNILENMHEYFQNIIKSSQEYKEKIGLEDPDTQEVPFPSANDEPDVIPDDLPF